MNRGSRGISQTCPLAIRTALTLGAVFRLAFRQTEGLIGSLVQRLGLTLCGPGAWLVETHGTRRRRSWRKLHSGIEADAGQIAAASLTAKEVDDGAEVGALLDQVARDGRDRAGTTRPPPPVHCQARACGLAEGIRLHATSAGRGRGRALETGDRG